jgi:hypothetical protein
MTTLSFPSNPSLNDTYSFNGKTWIWNGSAWDLQSSGAINDIPIGNVTPASGAFTTLSSTGNTTVGNINGNLIPAANSVFSLGSPTAQWANLYLTGNTIYLGNLQLKDSGTNSLAVYSNDGNTPAEISGDISADSIIINDRGNLRFADTDSSHYVSFRAPATVSANVAWTLPGTDGTSNQALTTDGTGNLSWTTLSSPPGGSTTQIQYNNNGVFAGAANIVTDGSNLTLRAQGDLRFADSDSSHYVALQAPATVSANVTWTMPSADGTNGQVLVTNGSGTLSWASGGAATSIAVGDTSVTIVDSGTNGRIAFTTDNSNYINMYSPAASSTAYMIVSAANGTSEPAAGIEVSRGYGVHPGKTSNYYGIRSILAGFQGDSSTVAAIYGEAQIDTSVGVLGKASTTTTTSTAVMGWGNMGSDGYGAIVAFKANYSILGANPGNGTLVGLQISMPNYTRTGSSGGQYAIQYVSAYTGSNTQYFAYIERNNVERGSITVTTSGTAYNTTSDYRLKENVTPLSNALDDVTRLNPVKFSWKETGEESIGFIAHELQAVVPQAVTGIKDGTTTKQKKDADGNPIFNEDGTPVTEEVPAYQGVDTSFLVAHLTKAIQELKAELDLVKAELQALK